MKYRLLTLMMALTASTAQADVAKRLTGTFYGTRIWGEAYTSLVLPEQLTVDEPESAARITATDPASVAAIGTVQTISWETGSLQGRRIDAICVTKCRLTGTITVSPQGAGDWNIVKLDRIEALPDSFDFLRLSRFKGAASHARNVGYREIGRDDPWRKPLLDALRGPVQKDLGQPVIFEVSKLATMDGWAFVQATPRTPAGKPIDFSRTHHAQRQRDGVLDGDMVTALLKRSGTGWTVKTFVIGPTDVAWDDWDKEYGVPRALMF